MIQIVSITALILSSILCISLLNYFINRQMKGRFTENEIPLGVNLFKSILFICGGLLIAEISSTSKEVIQILSLGSGDSNTLLPFITYFSLFFGIVLIILSISLWFSTMIFTVITKGKNVFEYAMQNDVRSVILFGGIAISISLAVKSGIAELLSQIIQYPNSPMFH